MTTPEKVTWAFTQQGGYNYIIPCPAIVVKHNEKTVRIAVWSYRDNRIKFRNVAPDKLSPRAEDSEVDAGYVSYCRLAPRNERVIIPGISTRERRIYDICELKQADERGIRYHGFVNFKQRDEIVFTVVGATSLESGIWYDINTPRLKALIEQHEQEAAPEVTHD